MTGRPMTITKNPTVDIVPDSEATQIIVGSRDAPASTNLARPANDAGSSTNRPSDKEHVAPESMMVDTDPEVEEEDEEVPLATVVRGIPHKTKEDPKQPARANAVSTARPQDSRPNSRTSSASGVKDHHEPTVIMKKMMPHKSPRRRDRSWQDAVVPSSKPHEDVDPDPERLPTQAQKAVPSKSKRPRSDGSVGEPARPRSFTPKTPPRKRRKMASVIESEDEEGDEADSVAARSDDGEVATELADEDYMDVDSTVGSGRKVAPARRRRGPLTRAPVRKATAKTNSNTNANKAALTTPLTRSGRKQKPSSSTIRAGSQGATRVIALWKQDSYFYPGTVHSMVSESPPRYRINFDDGTCDIVDLAKMRLCDLRPDDHVLLAGGTSRYAVVEVSSCGPEGNVTLEWDDSHEVEQMVVEVKDIRIASRTLQSEWKDRMLDVSSVSPIIQPKPSVKNTPPPSRASVVSTGSSRNGSRLFAKTGFIVTMSPGNRNWEQDKDRLISIIKVNGGVVIEDWLEIFSMEGTHYRENKRWTARSEDVKWIERKDVEKVFLLSDDASQKPKYLIALALGIPCVSIDWLDAVVEAVSLYHLRTSCPCIDNLVRAWRRIGSHSFFLLAIATR